MQRPEGQIEIQRDGSTDWRRRILIVVAVVASLAVAGALHVVGVLPPGG